MDLGRQRPGGLIAGIVIWLTRPRDGGRDRSGAGEGERSGSTAAQPGPRTAIGGVALVLAVSGVILIGLGSWFAFSERGIGWSLSGNTLTVKTGFGAARLQTSQADAQWVSGTGPYALAIRTNGVSAGALQAGHFQLRGGDAALVMRYGSHPWLLVQSGNTKVLISTPGVSALGRQLVRAQGKQAGASPEPGSADSGQGRLWFVRLLIAAVIAAGFVAAQQQLARRQAPGLPDRLVTHWGIDGRPNGWMSKRSAMRFMSAMSALLGAVGVLTAFAGYAAVIMMGAVQLLAYAAAWYVYRVNAKG